MLSFASAQSPNTASLSTLTSFTGADGSEPGYGALIQGTDGNLYGTTIQGGGCAAISYGCGTLYRITTGGTLTILHRFAGTDGSAPQSGLVQATNGVFYGTTYSGGANNHGTVFSITPAGKFAVLYSFSGTSDGGSPIGGLVQASNETLYGTTSAGGAGSCGTVFGITTTGTLTTLLTFTGANGCQPESSLFEGSSGILFGTTFSGGPASDGTVFGLTTSGDLTTYASFDGTDGQYPNGIIQGSDGNLYGTTSSGGSGLLGTVFEVNLSSDTLTTIYTFSGSGPGPVSPHSGLIEGPDGRLFGVTENGGTSHVGTVYTISGGDLTTLVSFDTTNGALPLGGLVQSASHTLFGTTERGGKDEDGTVFSLDVTSGLVSALP
jgi:uncharacterized repeat protein (TIGR03803 family)